MRVGSSVDEASCGWLPAVALTVTSPDAVTLVNATTAGL